MESRYQDPEDEAFNELERRAQQRKEAVNAAVKAAVEHPDRMYRSGWNSALEMAAIKIEHDFVKAFGKDTLSSISIYIRGMKK